MWLAERHTSSTAFVLLAPKVSTAATRCQRAGLPLFAQKCSFRWQAASWHLYELLVLGQNITPHGAVSQLASWASCASSVMTPGLTAVTAGPDRRFPFANDVCWFNSHSCQNQVTSTSHWLHFLPSPGHQLPSPCFLHMSNQSLTPPSRHWLYHPPIWNVECLKYVI